MLKPAEQIWDREQQGRNSKMGRAASVLRASLHDKVVSADMAVRRLEAMLEPGDRVWLWASTATECRA
jgi:hypothetical protein